MKTIYRLLTKPFLLFISLLFSIASLAQTANDFVGKWRGAIDVMGNELKLQVQFTQTEEGTWSGKLTIPAQRIQDLPLEAVEVDDTKISFALPADKIPGNAKFSGNLSTSKAFAGDFTQSGQTFPMAMEKQAVGGSANQRVTVERIKAMADSLIQKNKAVGIAIGIVKEGEIMLAEGFGYRDQAQKLPVTADTQFGIGSTSKAFTTFGLGLLADEGLLDWDTPIRNYLPEFELKDPFASQQMNAIDLTTHRSGLPRHDLLWYGSDLSRRELLHRLRYLEPSEPFRSKWQYQNLMYMTAGILIEEISGTSWEKFTQERILNPLGMQDTNFSVNDLAKASNRAVGYAIEEDQTKVLPYRNIDAVGPAGSINSTVNDMLKWVQVHLNSGKIGDQQLLSAGEVARLHTPFEIISGKSASPAFQEFSAPAYGLGWMIYDYQGHTIIEHGGNIDGFSAQVWLLPNDQIGMIILSNTNGTAAPKILANYATDLLLELEEKDWFTSIYGTKNDKETAAEKEEESKNRIPNTKPSLALDDYVGTYEDAGYGPIEITLSGNQLQLKYHNFTMPMEHWHFDVFQGEITELDTETKLQFTLDMNGNVAALHMNMDPSVPDIVFERQSDFDLTDNAFVQRLTGIYASEGMEVTIAKQGNKLTMFVPGQPLYTLEPYRDGWFNVKELPDSYQVEFVLEAGNKSKELILHQPNGDFSLIRK